MERKMPRIGSIPDMERVRKLALPELTERFTANSELTFAIVGESGSVYHYGREEDRAEAEEFCRSDDPREELLFIFGRPSVDNPSEHELCAAFLGDVSEKLGPVASSGSFEVVDEKGVTHRRFFALIEPEFPEF